MFYVTAIESTAVFVPPLWPVLSPSPPENYPLRHKYCVINLRRNSISRFHGAPILNIFVWIFGAKCADFKSGIDFCYFGKDFLNGIYFWGIYLLKMINGE